MDMKSRSKVDMKSRSKMDMKSRSKVDMKSRSKMDMKSRSKVDMKSRSKMDMKSRSKVDMKSRSKMDMKSRSKVDMKSRSKALSKKHDGIDSVSIETDSKKRMEKNRPEKSQLVQKNGKGVRNFRNGRGLLGDVWDLGEKALDAVADHAIESDNQENGLVDRSSVEEQRGKKKKKKKAILKLLILGAVLKAKIGTLLQILSFKLQVKFFIIALIGLGINLARFWVELKNKHQQQPQKVIYYEHAQHQHHYEHEEEPGWGPWSRSIEPEENEGELGVKNSPYRGQENNAQSYPTRPLLTLS
ncbi:hypothetical protein KGM_214547 [Danaus plexippus plexippus]|uniref:Uncharacterized protein n=1 Tax=Danaus plexippus plexippus TaxID=278856 RepID=A0A212F301_DANPL|nr:hypothetical protein KGM_214547 [Danaus plexippus plexippus]